MSPFHYSFKVKDLPSTRQFYIDILGCKEGRSTDTWIDFDFFGHQLSAHLASQIPEPDYCGRVDQIAVPIPHFGCILPLDSFKIIQQRLELAQIPFIIPPQIRYKGEAGEQHSMFILDFSKNAIEFKAFTKPDEVFKK